MTEEPTNSKEWMWLIVTNEDGCLGLRHWEVERVSTASGLWKAYGAFYIHGYDAFFTEEHAAKRLLALSLRQTLKKELETREMREQHERAVKYYNLRLDSAGEK